MPSPDVPGLGGSHPRLGEDAMSDRAREVWEGQFNALAQHLMDVDAVIVQDGETFIDPVWAYQHKAIVDAYCSAVSIGYAEGWLS